jgi:F0F1-type ATP synthase membrane subunit b/b'
MKSKIILLILLLFINIGLTIYLIYKCFNNKIIEGKKVRIKVKSPKEIGKDIGRAFDSGVDAARREAERIAEETRREAERIAEEARREAERIAEEARREAEKFVFDSFEKLLNPISAFFSTLQNTSSVLEQQGGNNNTELIKINRIGETQKIPKLGRGGRGMLNKLARKARESQGT